MKHLILSSIFLLFAGYSAFSQCGVCPGGSKTLTIGTPSGGTGPFTYNWTGGGTSPTKTVLAGGTYTVTVTDANSCTSTASYTVLTFTAPTPTLVATNGTCGNLGSINNTVTGGQSPYTYAWSNSATTEDITGLASGTYTVTVTDANGCTGTATATITNTLGFTLPPITCN